MIIDGKNAVLGRLSTLVARELLSGNEVTIFNAEKVIITGSPKKTVGDYLKKRRIGSPHHGPFFPKMPNLIVRRTIEGMLPKSKKGRSAFKRLKVYIDTPEGLNKNDVTSIEAKNPKTDFISIGELSKSLGWKGK